VAGSAVSSKYFLITSLLSIINRKRVSLDIELQGAGVTLLHKRAPDINFNIVEYGASGDRSVRLCCGARPVRARATTRLQSRFM
jgi:hypothetical protein